MWSPARAFWLFHGYRLWFLVSWFAVDMVSYEMIAILSMVRFVMMYVFRYTCKRKVKKSKKDGFEEILA